jgi:predicted AAA+ superfamily ATPase
MVLSELKKCIVNTNSQQRLYFWRDNSGHEIDCIVDSGSSLRAVEIKSGMTITTDSFRGLKYWHKPTGFSPKESMLVYSGTENQTRAYGQVVRWKSVREVVEG